MKKSVRWTVSIFATFVLFSKSVKCLAARKPGHPDSCQKTLAEQDPTAALPKIQPIILKTLSKPFDDHRYLFEMKYDGFRSVLYVEHGRGCRMISRNGNRLTQFQTLCDTIAAELNVRNAIFDGEVISFDSTGRPTFERLLRRQGPFHYVAFDLLWLDGQDLRFLPLEARRERLLQVLPKRSRFISESLAVVGDGERLFNIMAENDLEGIVAKRLADRYLRSTKWYKIKNKTYSQAAGRAKFFR